jgi:uncharacterized lipoprotein YmbA
MKFTARPVLFIGLFSLAASLLCVGGCLFKPTTMATRSFVLTQVSSEGAAGEPARHLSIGVGLVQMPPYLMKSPIVIRKGANEIEYVDNAIWAERLNDLFQRNLASNLAVLIPTDQVRVSSWQRDAVAFGVYVSVEQFDVDSTGVGRLSAWWRIVKPADDKVLKSGQARLSQVGPSPLGHPEVVASTLSGLSSEFSRGLAKAIQDLAAAPAAAR